MDSAVIVGAGVFGASLAWRLARAGVAVTLVDQFEPGDPRATSGGESRLIRCGHGPDATYTASARRARDAVARARVRVRRGADGRVRLRLDGPRRGRLRGRRARRTMTAQGSRASGSSPPPASRLFPSFGADRHRLPALRARGRGAARPARDAGAGAPGRRPWRDASSARRRRAGRRPGPAGRRAHARGGRRRLGLRRVARRAVPRRRSRSARPARSSSSSPAGRRGRRTASPRSSTSTTRSTARGDLDGLGVKAAPDFDGPPLAPDAELPPATARVGARSPAPSCASASRRSPTRRSPARSRCRYELTPDAHFVARRCRSIRPCGCSAAAPATASSTARRSPRPSPRRCAAARRCRRAVRARRARGTLAAVPDRGRDPG